MIVDEICKVRCSLIEDVSIYHVVTDQYLAVWCLADRCSITMRLLRCYRSCERGIAYQKECIGALQPNVDSVRLSTSSLNQVNSRLRARYQRSDMAWNCLRECFEYYVKRKIVYPAACSVRETLQSIKGNE